jgi:hypothetical protein
MSNRPYGHPCPAGLVHACLGLVALRLADDRERHRAQGPLPIVRQPSDILGLALHVAAQHGVANPELVRHTTGTREAVTGTTGSIVFDDHPSYLIAVRGAFTARGRGRWVPALAPAPSFPGRRRLLLGAGPGRRHRLRTHHRQPQLRPLSRPRFGWSGRHLLPVLLVANDPRVPGLAMWWARRATRCARSDSPDSRRPDRHLRPGLDGQGSPVSGDVNTSGFRLCSHEAAAAALE